MLVLVGVLCLILGVLIGARYAKSLAKAKEEGYQIANVHKCHKECQQIVSNPSLDGLEKLKQLMELERPWGENEEALETIARYRGLIAPSIKMSAEENELLAELGNQIH